MVRGNVMTEQDDETKPDAPCPDCGKPMVPSALLDYPPICSDYFCASGKRPRRQSTGEILSDLVKALKRSGQSRTKG